MKPSVRTTQRDVLNQKMEMLKSNLREMGSVIIAYSGGIDSTFLSVVASQTLGSQLLAVTAKSPSLASSEFNAAVNIARRLGLNHRVIETAEVQREDYRANDTNRCFFCKDELYTRLTHLAKEEGYAFVANGTNTDDLGDYRPGLNAAKRYNVLSPMVEAGFTKLDIRNLSQQMKLPNWDKPAQACLSSRIPYGVSVSEEVLARIARAEEFLHDIGIDQLRVRHHGNVARIEVESSNFAILLDEETRIKITQFFRSIGYLYITLDLDGFRSGSLNEIFSTEGRQDVAPYISNNRD